MAIFSKPRQPVDGVFGQLFPVRDLASHYQLAWLPVSGPTAEAAIAAMRELFAEHGAPLIVKCDNGSAFISAAFRAFLAEHGVLLLYSPPLTPSYNGGVERANGTLKTYTQQHAAAEQHPFRWTSEDVEAARKLANTLTRPWGYRGPTTEEVWQSRQHLGEAERAAFRAAVEGERAAARLELGLAKGDLNREDQARLDRVALQRALCALGYLEMHRADRVKKTKRLSRKELTKRAAEAGLSVNESVGASAGGGSAGGKNRPPANVDRQEIVTERSAAPAAGEPSRAAESPLELLVESPVESPPRSTIAVLVSLDVAWLWSCLTGPPPPADAETFPNATPPRRASSLAAREKETLQLAPPMAADTMREEAEGEPDARDSPTPPAPAAVKPAKPP